MRLASLFRSALLALPFLFFMAACDTVGDGPFIDSAAPSSDAPLPSDYTISVVPSTPLTGEEVTLTLEAPSEYDLSGASPTWALEEGETLGNGLSVKHIFDTAGEYRVSVAVLPGEVTAESVVFVRDGQ
jgi:hypothetical protein